MLSIGTRSECLHRSDLLSQLISFRDVRLNEVRLDAGPAEINDDHLFDEWLVLRDDTRHAPRDTEAKHKGAFGTVSLSQMKQSLAALLKHDGVITKACPCMKRRK